MRNRPLLIAHRGGAAEAPENTLGAFRRALNLGIRWFELDVQMTTDGALVVIHDDTVDRTTNGTGPVAAYSFEQIRNLDAGSQFSPEFAGEKIPTLREVLDLCAEQGAGVFIELKSPHLYPRIEEKVASLLGELWTQGVHNMWCISFDPAAVARMHEIDPLLSLGQLYGLQTEGFPSHSEVFDAVLPHFAMAAHFPEQVSEAHRNGKQVIVWTVNRPEDMRQMAELGVDGIMSDNPSLLLDTLR